MPTSDNTEGVRDGDCENFAVYQQRIVYWKLLRSRYRTSLAGQAMRVSSPKSQDW